ncbi:MAG: TadE/TadG family type IV pilus assembly protein [Bryobacteraceae bacterium]
MRQHVSTRRGSLMMENALWVPILVALLFGMAELARVSYTYYTLHKILYGIARLAGTQQGVNFCDGSDATVTNIKNFVLNGSIDDGAQPILTGLSSDQIDIRIERYVADSDSLEQCDCSDTGCDAAQGGGAPDYIAVSIPDGYPIRLSFPGLTLDPIPLRPMVRVPYGGS